MITLNINGNPFQKIPKATSLADEAGVWLVALQETHTTADSVNSITQLIPSWSAYWEHGTSNSNGVAILIKNNTQIENVKVIERRSGRIIGVEVKMTNRTFLVYSMYAPADMNGFLEWYKELNLLWAREFYLGGDFNADMTAKETDRRAGFSRVKRKAAVVKEWLSSMNMVLHQVKPRSHSWARNGNQLSTLDYWGSNQHEGKLKTFYRIFPWSDHKAVVAVFNPFSRNGKSWKLNVSIFSKREYKERMILATESCWECLQEDKVKTLSEKWSTIKGILRREAQCISKEEAHFRKEKINDLESNINELQQLGVNDTSITLRLVEAKEKLKGELKYRKDGAAIRSKLNSGTAGGDLKLLKLLKPQRNEAAVITSKDGLNVLTVEQARNEIETFYKDLYSPINCKMGEYFSIAKTSDTPWGATTTNIVNGSDIAKAAGMLNSWKSPGPDGLQPVVWEKVPKLCSILASVWSKAVEINELPKELQLGTLRLIPKKKGGGPIDSFRPITMLNSDYKTIAKALATKIKPFVSEAVIKHQFGFTPGKDIRTAIMIATQKIEQAEARKRPMHAVLLDFTKAFDSVGHEFLLEALRWHRLPQEFIKQVETLTSCAKVIAIHGEIKTSPISIARGVRQGCPLSPFLFVLAIDKLLRNIESRLGSHCGGPRLVAFADDVTVFLNSNPGELEVLLECLHEFELASGCKVNNSKTVVLSTSEPLQGSNWTQVEPGNSTRLLGVQIGPTSKENERCEQLINILKGKCRIFSKGSNNIINKTLMANCLIASSIAHHLYFRLISTKQAKRMQRELNQFVSGKCKRFTPSETLLCSPRNDGGLGLFNMASKSKAALGHWACSNDVVTPIPGPRKAAPFTARVMKDKVVHSALSNCEHTHKNRYGVNLYEVLRKKKEGEKKAAVRLNKKMDETMMSDLKMTHKRAKECKLTSSEASLMWKLRANKAPQKLNSNFRRADCIRCGQQKPNMDHLLVQCPAIYKETRKLVDKIEENPPTSNVTQALKKLNKRKLKLWANHVLQSWKQYWAVVMHSREENNIRTPTLSFEPTPYINWVWVDHSLAET
jgi:Reverse transcriptase (RNA-dependent DNA polymerase)